ncbi:MAG: NAD(P)H-dependent glycerol-3-phosphate dehydrogenase, partial [Longimicrobiales bacterium]|nr:NAD(P)H-dependent glycerol-3-phosphate dehydrogenase [Longimicrobiales bacterium]
MTLRAAVLGGGAWGTALASVLARNGHSVVLWAREPEVVEGVNREHRNPVFLPEVTLPAGLRATDDLPTALEGAELLVNAVPAQFVRSVWERARVTRGDVLVVSASKGIENGSLKLMNQVLEEVLPPVLHPRIAVLSGPSFAAEVARGVPTAVSIACGDPGLAEELQRIFSGPTFRAYTHDDLVGVELGGALKNVIALAAGISDGLGFGHNS